MDLMADFGSFVFAAILVALAFGLRKLDRALDRWRSPAPHPPALPPPPRPD
jgi:hypothetical protein